MPGEKNESIISYKNRLFNEHEPEIYGTQTLEEIESKIQKYAETLTFAANSFQELRRNAAINAEL